MNEAKTIWYMLKYVGWNKDTIYSIKRYASIYPNTRKKFLIMIIK